MTTRRARRSVRSATLVAVAAAAVLSMTACQSAGGDAASGQGKAGSVSTARLADTSGDRSTAEVQIASSKAASPVRKQTLADGSTAVIRKIGTQHYRAEIVSNGDVLATLEANGKDAGLDANDMFVVLTLDGQVHSWLGGGHSGPGTFELAGGWKAKVTQLGDLHYRAEILGLDGSVMGTLEADEQDAGLVANGIYIVLSAGGVISAHE
ncbi:hypothetical protein AB0I16_22830 [Streptomyces sp. NPDC050703]|uniref:hypothetical protein n=1 Tax=Streptomyces sp. NPDC050703 TaxID=3157218 RepID=UPI00344AC557